MGQKILRSVPNEELLTVFLCTLITGEQLESCPLRVMGRRSTAKVINRVRLVQSLLDLMVSYSPKASLQMQMVIVVEVCKEDSNSNTKNGIFLKSYENCVM